MDKRALFSAENDSESELCKSLEKQIRDLKRKIGMLKLYISLINNISFTFLKYLITEIY